MANELIGMFGQSPEMTQLGLQQGRDANMAQLAQMSKGSMLAYGAGTAADRLGGAVGGMLGGTDPRMEEANLDKQIQQEVMMEVQQLGIDPTKDWEKFGTIAAQKYNAAGKPDKAFQISQAIEKMKATQADTSLKNAQAAKALKEKQYIPVGKNLFNQTTGEWVKQPEGMAGVIDVNNPYDVMNALAEHNQKLASGIPIDPKTNNYMQGLLALAGKPQIAANGTVIQPVDVKALFPNMFKQGETQQPTSITTPEVDPTKYQKDVDNMVSQGVERALAEKRAMQMQGRTLTGETPLPEGSRRVGGAIVTPDPVMQKEAKRVDAFKIEQQLGDDLTKATSGREKAIDATDRVRALLKDPKNPSAMNAAATVGQHILEPENQALQGEINRLMGGGNAWEQAKGLYSKVVDGTASQQQIEWFARFAEALRKVEVEKYKTDLQVYSDKATTYATGNPEIKPSNVVNTRKLAKYEGVPYVSTPEELQKLKLKPGTKFYTPDSLTPRIAK